jgi:hypothetical protein
MDTWSKSFQTQYSQFYICMISLPISNKFVKNESYQFFMNLCKPNVAYFTSILQKNWLKIIEKNLFYQTVLIKTT